MQLKTYQQNTLAALSSYFKDCLALQDYDMAFYRQTRRSYSPVSALPGLPYVCLRVPTGGGKTLLAAHSVGVCAREFLQHDRAVVLWLAPSETIVQQTLRALRQHGHPYRQAIENDMGAVEVMDIAQAQSVRPAVLNSATVVIVSTIQAFRSESTEGRKVYEDSGALMDHFSVAEATQIAELERETDGQLRRSLCNMLRLRRPIVIVDEAHNARTSLSFDTLARLLPACILEFTATPARKQDASNVLYSVSAAELNAEDMIKMPIALETRDEWRIVLADAIDTLKKLDALAQTERQSTGEYVRPIMLIQAERNVKQAEAVTVDVIRQTLLDEFGVAENQIARATGDYDELPDDIQREHCPIRYVITQQKLREGWDCPFAYVLCSVAEVRSATAVEQILGRILRLPKAKRKVNDALNHAYAFVASRNFAAVAAALKDALIENGFDKQEVADLVVSQSLGTLPIFSSPPDTDVDSAPDPALPLQIAVNSQPDFSTLPFGLANKVSYNAVNGTVTIRENLNESELQAFNLTLQSPTDRAVIAYQVRRQRQLRPPPRTQTPAERGEAFAVPVLAYRQGNLIEPFEETHLRDIPFELAKYDATLSENDFTPSTRGATKGIIGMQKGHVYVQFTEQLHEQMDRLSGAFDDSKTDLVQWLDRSFAKVGEHEDFDRQHGVAFANAAVTHLLDTRQLPLSELVRDKFSLSKCLLERIKNHRRALHRNGIQNLLLSNLLVNDEHVFQFDPNPNKYAYNQLYTGHYQFNKHYYPKIDDLTESQGRDSEYQCAIFIDQLSQVKYWVRNLVRKPNSFSLQTSTGRFYPDFVCLLRDGRILVVENKGAHLWENAKEDREIGELWAKRSGGKCLFVMVRNGNFAEIVNCM